MESNIAYIARLLGDSELGKDFQHKSERRFQAIDEVLWDEEGHQWRDLWLSDVHDDNTSTGQHQQGQGEGKGGSAYDASFEGTFENKETYASNWLPLLNDQCACGEKTAAVIAS